MEFVWCIVEYDVLTRFTLLLQTIMHLSGLEKKVREKKGKRKERRRKVSRM